MIVCLCEGANEEFVKVCIAAGCNSIKELVEQYNVCADCKKCHNQLKELLKNEGNS